MIKILITNPNKEEYSKITRVFTKLNYHTVQADDINGTLQEIQSGDFDLVILYQEAVKIQNIGDVVAKIKDCNSELLVILVTKKPKKIDLKNVFICSEKFHDILFCIEQVLQENEATSLPVIVETEILTEPQRQDLRRKRQLAVISTRLAGFVSGMLSKKQ